MTRFYTRKGDDGFTGLLGEGRVPKYHPRPETFGELDEATAAIGLARSLCQAPESGALLMQVQRDLYYMMAEAAATEENAARFRKIDDGRVKWLEAQMDDLGERVHMPDEFILPGDCPAAGALALARTIVRRAERRMAEMVHSGDIENAQLLRYLNRLSSLLFALELLENQTNSDKPPTLAKEHD